MALSPSDATAAANGLFGRHPGRRALHAKGTILTGTFTATPDAAKLTRAGHMQGEPVPTTVRVSNGGGDPDVPDYAPDVRGLAIKFYLPDDTRTDIVAQSAPKFPFHGPEGFVELLRAQRKSPAIAWRLPRLLARYPGLIPTIPANVKALAPPVSYASIDYYAVHAFRFTAADGGSRFVRYTIRPERPEPVLSSGEAKQRGRDYLQQDILERAARGSARFILELQLAAEGDAVDDPSSRWPADRQRVNAGTLELTGPDTKRETGEDVLVFDPTRIVDGIECSDDPVLRFRSRAYSDSISRRIQG
jgi:catalase